MAITLGAITFDEANTTVREHYEEVGGRDARRIEITGIITGQHAVADAEAVLDVILNAASRENYDAELSIRDDRRLMVRRAKFTREICRATCVASFVLTLEAEDPFEQSTDLRYFSWQIAAPGATKAITTSGNVFAYPVITLAAMGNLVNPTLSDGTRAITFLGTVRTGESLVADSAARTVTVNGEDVTCYTTGLFPQIDPAGTTLTYTDDASSAHTASGSITLRDRWW